jgi:TetR/AcrR family transcriptional regulator, cholesterol catabolism regulator
MEVELEDRAQRIVDVAVELAEGGGFQAVRLRDVAQKADVALGTLYARFKSKEDILVAALEQETRRLEVLLSEVPISGSSPHDRVGAFFEITSHALFARPNFARAVLRSVSSGVPEIAEKVRSFQGRMTRLIIACIHDAPAPVESEDELDLTRPQRGIGYFLQDIWFASLVGWMSGLKSETEVISYMRAATELLVVDLESS